MLAHAQAASLDAKQANRRELARLESTPWGLVTIEQGTDVGHDSRRHPARPVKVTLAVSPRLTFECLGARETMSNRQTLMKAAPG